MTKSEILLVLFLAPIIFGMSCAESTDAQDDASVTQGEEAAPLPDANLTRLYTGNRSFAFDMYAKLSEEAEQLEHENILFSPYSISLALAMTYAGARGDTETEMAQTLHFTLPQDDLHPAFNTLCRILEDRTSESDDRTILMAIANSLWGQTGWDFLPEYLSLIEQNYGAGLKEVDFGSNPEACRVEINEWVEQETRDKIIDLIPEGVISSLTTLVLVNAIYFKGTWLWQFDPEDTNDGRFYLLDGLIVNVPMMHQYGQFNVADLDDCQAVEIPYTGEKLSMVLILPRGGGFEEFEDLFDQDTVDEILNSLSSEEIDMYIPRFELEIPYEEMATTLAEMGMPSAFVGADFSGIDGSRLMYISAVIHKAFISVNEEGTEASAATAVVTRSLGAPSPSFMANRPFIFLIRDIETNTILFMGRLLKPEEVQ